MNEEPVEKWMAVWRNLNYAEYCQNSYEPSVEGALNALTEALQGLFVLLEPPSVREVRLRS